MKIEELNWEPCQNALLDGGPGQYVLTQADLPVRRDTKPDPAPEPKQEEHKPWMKN